MKYVFACLVCATGLNAGAAAAGPFVPGGIHLRAAAEPVHWVRKGPGGYGGPPYGIEYSRSYSYAFTSGYYRSGYAGCRGVQHMCASQWGWGGSNYRRCLWSHRWC